MFLLTPPIKRKELRTLKAQPAREELLEQVEEIKAYLKLLTGSTSQLGECAERLRADECSEEDIQDIICKLQFIKQEFEELLKNSPTKHDNTSKKDVLQNLKSILPENYYITNNKLSNEISKDFLDNGEIALAVVKVNKKGEVCTYNSLAYEGKDMEISGRQQFTAYDRAVHNAVCTLFAAGNKAFTAEMVYRAMNGYLNSEYASPQAIGAVTKSIEKSRSTRLKVDFTAEAKARGIRGDKFTMNDMLLSAKNVTVVSGGYKKDAYAFNAKPILYEYSQLTKQVLSIPIALLDTSKATRSTEDVIIIREYLLRRIEIMKNNKGINNKIVYDTIFQEAGIINPTKEKSFKLRKAVKSILELWQENKYIQGFVEYKEGNVVKGVEIKY